MTQTEQSWLDLLRFEDKLLWAASEKGAIISNGRQNKGRNQSIESVMGRTASTKAESAKLRATGVYSLQSSG